MSEQALGILYLDSGDIIEAESRFKTASNIFLRTNYKVGIATVYNHFGQVQINKGRLQEALIWLEKSENASREVDKEQYIISLNKQGRVKALQQQWKEALSLFEQAIAIARQVPAYYQLTESLINLADTVEHLNQGDRVQQLLQEADNIATKENYLSLLGLIEYAKGYKKYRNRDYMQAFQHFVLYCEYMSQYNSTEFSTAVERVVDALLDIPKDVVPAIMHEMLTYWTTHQLDKTYPELMQAFEEIDTLMTL